MSKKSRTNIRGRKFGNLLAIKPMTKVKTNQMWDCVCICGKHITVQAGNLVSGNTKSCGCYRQLVSRSRQVYPGTPAQRLVFRNYRKTALQRGLCFELTPEEVYSLCEKNCYYCGTAPKTNSKSYVFYNKHQNGEGFLRNGIDRIDNTVGYRHGNVVPCCYDCNAAKRTMALRQFISWVGSVHAAMNNKEVLEFGAGI